MLQVVDIPKQVTTFCNMRNYLNDAEKEEFHAHIHAWQKRLNLDDWRFVFHNKPAKGAMSDIVTNLSNRTAVYRVGDFAGELKDSYTLETTACHEALHVLVDELIEVVKAGVSEDLQMAAQHRVVITLERLLVPQPQKATHV